MSTSSDTKTIVIHANYWAFVQFITILTLFNSIYYFLIDDPEKKNVILILYAILCTLLLIDTFYRIFRAPEKRLFMFGMKGWMLLVGSLPIPGFQLIRLLHSTLLLRKWKRNNFKDLGYSIVAERAQTSLLTTVLIALLVIEFGSLWILSAEQYAVDSNIKNASDALWWMWVTIATVGYGDRYPVTNPGRIVGWLVITAGVGLFSVLTGFLADWFKSSRRNLPDQTSRIPEEANELNQKALSDIHQLLLKQEQDFLTRHEELRARLELLEKQPPKE